MRLTTLVALIAGALSCAKTVLPPLEFSAERAEPGYRYSRAVGESPTSEYLHVLSLAVPFGWTVGGKAGSGPPYWSLMIRPPCEGPCPTALTVSVFRRLEDSDQFLRGFRDPTHLEPIEAPPYREVDGMTARHWEGRTRRHVCFDAVNSDVDDGCGTTSPLREYAVIFDGPTARYLCHYSEDFDDPDFEHYLYQALEVCASAIRVDRPVGRRITPIRPRLSTARTTPRR